jgi:RHH-type proline utilization regulon transcriptional repressor/proline dehydrogenase/delta 1-pyrroline-5-carboxylate dehydrogenase
MPHERQKCGSLLFTTPLPGSSSERRAISALHLADEAEALAALLPEAQFWPEARARIEASAAELVRQVRERRGLSAFDAFLHEYDLGSEEGVILMCLAESLLRIPDAHTADTLIHDKLAAAHWDQHLGNSGSVLVNASTWGMLLSGRLLQLEAQPGEGAGALLQRLLARSGEPVVRSAMKQAMHLLAHQFVMGRTLEEALGRTVSGYRYSYDMLGEAALTAEDAERYFQAYSEAIARLGKAVGEEALFARPGISVKLSALHPRYEHTQHNWVLAELGARLLELATAARDAGITLTVDAEEARRLELSLDLFEQVFANRALAGWEGFGLAVQAYQKRAPAVIDFLAQLAQRHGRRIPLRLVKGAYWDTEIKSAQQQGLEGYPVFTRKANTDLSYLACARRILERRDCFYPQFATHNAHTVAAIREMAGTDSDYEFQRLHGMGEALYATVVERDGWNVPCRVYAPVGSHCELLPYLVRRLLENGANTSFVNRISDERIPVQAIIADPAGRVRSHSQPTHPRIPLPRDLFGEGRVNSQGICFDEPLALEAFECEIAAALELTWRAAPLIDGSAAGGEVRVVHAPHDSERDLGEVVEADEAQALLAMERAAAAFPAWRLSDVQQRAAALERAAELFEQHRGELVARCVMEGGRTVANALDEVREAVDACRYYAQQARALFAEPVCLPGPAGEENRLRLFGRGVFACIAPWNFPVAIFCGQIAAALAAGNSVVAKPARATPLCAARVVELFHLAGIPAGVLQFVPGASEQLAEPLLTHPALAGVAFTGSTATARQIAQTLAARDGPLVTLIAETGGQNAMLVDSTALLEQVVADVLPSAFDSAGQRCSALRVLLLQEEIAERVIRMLQGAMAELRIGEPMRLATDIGPVIDHAAQKNLERYIARMKEEARLLQSTPLPSTAGHGSFVAPHLFEIDSLAQLQGEVFGPILHVLRFAAGRLDELIDDVNATGYGLTLGIHSRIDTTARTIGERVRVGNVYVNRNMIGAVVGSQPFGGQGLSGTGPKAGGPHYLPAFATEQSVSSNTAAIGGNASLLAGEED